MRFVSLGSGSSGNCALVSYNSTNILVDCGLSYKRIEESLNKYDLSFDDINALFITHLHSDHIKALPQIIKRNNFNIYGEEKTLKNIIKDYSKFGKNKNEELFDKLQKQLNIVRDGVQKKIKNITVTPIETFHDVPSLCYSFKLGNLFKCAILTDTGKVSDYILNCVKDSNAIMLEANYNKDMLLSCIKYPYYLKERIDSDLGHLSNEDCADIITKINSPSLKVVALSHISENSNTYEMAYDSVINYIKKYYKEKIPLPKIIIAKREEITEVLNINE